jgi:hypothetical protein
VNATPERQGLKPEETENGCLKAAALTRMRDAQNGTSEFLRGLPRGRFGGGGDWAAMPTLRGLPPPANNFCLLAAFCGRVFCSTGRFLQLPAPFVRRLSSAPRSALALAKRATAKARSSSEDSLIMDVRTGAIAPQ